MRLAHECVETLPRLAWCARITAGAEVVDVTHGPWVEIWSDGFCVGAWDGPFEARGFAEAVTLVGSGGRVTDDGVLFAASTNVMSRIYSLRDGDRLIVSNSLSFLLAQAGDALDLGHPHYYFDFLRHKRRGLTGPTVSIPTARANQLLLHHYTNVFVRPDLSWRAPGGGNHAGARLLIWAAAGRCRRRRVLDIAARAAQNAQEDRKSQFRPRWPRHSRTSQVQRKGTAMNETRSALFSHRSLWAVTLMLLALQWADATRAAEVDPRQLIPGMGGVLRREAAEKARRQKQEEQARSCDQLKSWFDAGSSPTPAGTTPRTADQLNRSAMALLEDSRFSAAFGKTYDQMTQEELGRLIREVLPTCFAQPNGPLAGTYEHLRGAAYQVLSPTQQANNVRRLTNARNATAELSRLTAEVQTLQPTEEGYSRLSNIRQAGDAATALAARPHVDAYVKAMGEAQERVATPVETARVAAAVAAASGYDGLVQLSKLSADLQKRSATNPSARDNLQALDTSIAKIGTELATTERSRIDALGSGMVGLERGVQWQSEYAQRYRPFASRVKSIGELQSYFSGRREATLAAASGELNQTIRRASSEEQLRALQQRYLLASDSATVPGTQILTTMAEQRRELEKRAALGASLEQERREAAATAAPRGTTAAPQQARATETATGEPTQEAMYDLVRARYEAEAERIRDLAKRCSSSRQANPTDAILCMSVSLVGGLGADQPVKITRFEKLGCALASGRPGYYCEFDYAVSGGPTKFLGPITQSLRGEGGVGGARFLHRSAGWIMIYKTE